jgi:radical SAM protein with 4Fe4S-binding SPASM domain
VNNQNRPQIFLRLHPQAALKRLEAPYIYHIGRDELYDIDEKAEAFLALCDGTLKRNEIESESEFVEYCLEEGLLESLSYPDQIYVSIDRSPVPSLRYLELQLLHRCNLKCRHCYLGPPRQDELSLHDALKITREFVSNGGLRLLISGGEPLLYPYLKDFLKETSGLKLRRVLLTNGTLITEENISWLHVENIQFSLDGWREGHDLLRGKGTFDQTIQGIRLARNTGIPISIATMIHQGNLNEFERIRSFTEEIGATEWGIDVLCVAGSLKYNRDLIVPYKQAAPFMKYAYGGGYHGLSDGFACGRHLMTVLPTGKAVKCGFYENSPLGDARKNLIASWLKLKHISLEDLECRGCPVINDCAGGCRFRASNPLAPDPVMCYFYGIK